MGGGVRGLQGGQMLGLQSRSSTQGVQGRNGAGSAALRAPHQQGAPLQGEQPLLDDFQISLSQEMEVEEEMEEEVSASAI